MRRQGYFDKGAADRAVLFINHLKHTKGVWAGQPFRLRKWQRDDIIRPLFGTMNPDGTRRYRTAYIELPRKNGKSELAAGIALYLLFADGEQGAEIYGAAYDRDQASAVFDVGAQMVRQQKSLRRRAKIIDSQKRIVVHSTNSFYRAVPADAAGNFAWNAHGIIFDELHTQKTRALWDALTTSQGTRKQPLTVAITTAGHDQESICFELHEYAQKILDGVVEDPTFFAYIRAAPADAAWQDPKEWKACNPALGDFLRTSFLRSEARRAREMPALQNTFRNFFLNQWTQQAERWIPLDLWDAQAGIVEEEKLRGRKCYGGLDLGSVSDLTAWVMVFPREDEHIDVLARFWCPEARLKDSANRYRHQYQVWAREGWLRVTPGEATDEVFVTKQILEDVRKFGLVDMNIDRLFQAQRISRDLIDELGEERVAGMGMGFLSMAAPMREIERRLLGRKVHHGGNPVLRWMADNVAVKKDAHENLKPDKANSQGKIDGIVALVMALDRAVRHQDKAVLWVAV